MATTTGAAIATSPARIPELDGIRGLAILLVIFYHVFVAVPAKSAFFGGVAWVFDYAWSGVDLFFVLSGFLIGGILLDCQGKRQWGVTFYARRFLRIFPLYYGWLLAIAVLTFLLERSSASQSSKDLFRWEMPPWMFPAFLQNFWLAQHRKFITPVLNATWSLAVEEQFYLVLPAIIYLTPRRRLAWVMGGAAACASALRTYSFYAQNHIAPYVLLACRADTFAAGVLLALLFRHPVSTCSTRR